MAVEYPQRVLRALMVAGLLAISSLEMAFLKTAAPGNQDKLKKGLDDLYQYAMSLGEGLIWPALGFGFLAIVIVAIMLMTGSTKAQTAAGFIVISIGMLVCSPGIMA